MAAAEDLPYALRLSGADPAAVTSALTSAGLALARRPGTTLQALGELTLAQLGVALDVARAAFDGEAELEGADRRFADRAWRANPFLRGVAGSYLATSRWAHHTLDALELDEQTAKKAHFGLGLFLDAAAPTNFAWLNPEVVKEAYDTGGLSLAKGAARFTEDVVRNGGRPQEVDRSAFELGRDLAATPGTVVFRNDLIELIAYAPQTERVYAEPLVYVPPWINKYYLMDMAPGRSWVEFAVRQGFTVFAVSWRNPDESMADLTMDDYLRDGLFSAVEQAGAVTGSERVNLVGVCVGGTLTAIALAVLAARGETERIGWAALLNTLVDFGDPGEIGVFTDEAAIGRIEERIRRRGYISADELGGPFLLMKANDLVWRYVVSSWLMGKRPPSFDLLAWNADGTRIPAAMHSQYLRSCYLDNALTRAGAMTIDGVPLAMSAVQTPLYVLGSEADHIVPWRSSYRTNLLVGGDVTYRLSSGGHIAGLVNPPGGNKAKLWAGEGNRTDPDAWRAAAEERSGSWWEDWAAWAAERSGEQVAPPTLPDGGPAPGRYVLE
jgi:poly[(R)-3-hydroxyalkanoate] polymerase subunit PhaC